MASTSTRRIVSSKRRLLAHALAERRENELQRCLIEEAIHWRPLPSRLRGAAPTLRATATRPQSGASRSGVPPADWRYDTEESSGLPDAGCWSLMRAEVVKPDFSSELMTPERCAIVEVWNSSGDPAVSIARARVAPQITTQLHAVDIDERYLILEGRGAMNVGKLKTWTLKSAMS